VTTTRSDHARSDISDLFHVGFLADYTLSHYVNTSSAIRFCVRVGPFLKGFGNLKLTPNHTFGIQPIQLILYRLEYLLYYGKAIYLKAQVLDIRAQVLGTLAAGKISATTAIELTRNESGPPE
jgi:hypothetical protein